MSRKVLTLAIAKKDGKVLLAMKKRGFGMGKWNGLGGKVEKGETIEQATIREAREEGGIEIKEMTSVGQLDFEFEGNPEIMEVHLFDVTRFEGEPVETEEMKPQWYEFDKIPYDSMWPDDRYWLPLFLAGKKFDGYFLFTKGDVIIKHELNERV